MEKNIKVRCLERDADIVKSVFQKAQEHYQGILQDQLKTNKDYTYNFLIKL